MPKPTKKSLDERIRAAWRAGIGYHKLMYAVFPETEYPAASGRSSNGGPPGCAMAFGVALRRLGVRRGRDGGTLHGTPAGEPGAAAARPGRCDARIEHHDRLLRVSRGQKPESVHAKPMLRPAGGKANS